MRKTKIIATLGPASDSPVMLGRLLDAGVNMFRLNMSHARHDWVRRVVVDIRAAAATRQIAVAILMDTQGPAIRTGDLPTALDLKPGQKFTLTVRGEKSEELHSVDVNYDDLINDISVGDVVLFDNGAIHMRVLTKHGNKIECEVLTEGRLGSRRHINLPGVKVSLPALTSKDLADIALGMELGVDYVALSFTREAKDLRQLRAVIASHPGPRQPGIIAKVEDQEALRNLDEITREADVIMVARGDLGIEIPYEELPIVQRRMVKSCLRLGKPVIVATHMLESMIENPMPTRAEITDVANAVFEQADAIMLSGETTVGKYPVACVQVFDRVARRIERSGGANYYEAAELTSPREKLARSAVRLADDLHADAIVIITRQGRMARHAAWLRPRSSPILAVCESAAVADGLALVYGIRPVVITFDPEHPGVSEERGLAVLREQGLIRAGQIIVVVTVLAQNGGFLDAVQVRTVE